MAKLSFWLTTLDKGKPFTFLDHALKGGDSLLGIADLDRLLHWSLAPARGPVTATFLTELVRRTLGRALALRRRIRRMPDRDVRDEERKATLPRQADEALDSVRLAADLLVAAALHTDPRRRDGVSAGFQPRMSVLAQGFAEVRAGRLSAAGAEPA